VAAGWADRGTARAVQARDSDWGVAEGRAAEVLAEVEPVALAVQGAAATVVPACGILVHQAAVEAKGRVRAAPEVEVAPEAGLAAAVVVAERAVVVVAAVVVAERAVVVVAAVVVAEPAVVVVAGLAEEAALAAVVLPEE
jgi:hypothetical protein